MEEILASIRRIISEDDTPGDEAEADAPAVAAAPAPVAKAPPPALEDDDEEELELVHKVEPAPKESVGDIDAYEKAEPPPVRNEPPPPRAAAPEPRPMPKPQPAPARDDDSLVSSPSAFAAASAFGQLSAAIAMPAAGRTLEDLVTELMKPLLKDWLDQNLAAIVEAKVADEVERIARGRVR